MKIPDSGEEGGGSGGSKSYDLDKTDTFWSEHLGAAFSDAAPNAPTWLVASDRLGFGLSPRPRDIRLYGQEAGATFALRLIESLVPLCAGQPSSPRVWSRHQRYPSRRSSLRQE